MVGLTVSSGERPLCEMVSESTLKVILPHETLPRWTTFLSPLFDSTEEGDAARAALFALIAGVCAAVAHLTDDWADWECPGFPCYIVNYFEYQPHGKLSQTCGGSD